jgi:Rieske Fe-S protein
LALSRHWFRRAAQTAWQQYGATNRTSALSMRCTHKGCEVAPPDDGIMICPCHDSRFDLSGAVAKPPATTPLKRYQTTYHADSRVVIIALA